MAGLIPKKTHPDNDKPGGERVTVTLDLGIALHRKVARKLGIKVGHAKRVNKYATRGQLEAALDKSSGCWVWTKSLNRYGYGTFMYRRKVHFAHRAMYELVYGPIPKGLVVMHSCDNPACCNPEHLSVGTHLENKRDSVAKRRHTFGGRCKNAILTPEQVKIIRAVGGVRGMQVRLSKEWGVSKSTINCAYRGKNWRHVETSGQA